MPRRVLPEPTFIPLHGQSYTSINPSTKSLPAPPPAEDARKAQIEEFLQSRPLKPRSCKSYRQDLHCFLRWTEESWAAISPVQIAQFKAYLERIDGGTGQRVLSEATVRRILGTLKSFYCWLFQAGYVTHNPTLRSKLPKVPPFEDSLLNTSDVERIFLAAARSKSPERNLGIIALLSHNLRASTVLELNVADYDGQAVSIRQARENARRAVPLEPLACQLIDYYLGWRAAYGEPLSPKTPLFVSYSRRSRGQRLSYDGLRTVIEEIESITGLDFHSHQLRQVFVTHSLLQQIYDNLANQTGEVANDNPARSLP